ncbi:hypothetical protein CesoFtcFv8_008755 [Champsocephalus esox]|uniref:Uncharacterized protein n=1 Tax=Champsocephalus esox TaxID=159716 RepID=A0AAN8H4F6_9TELE|nr:hypothetical protein CesoFtcFv8_008755 [Champsocephalus esox]
MEISAQDQQVPPPSPVTTPAPDDLLTEPQTRADLLQYYCHLTLDPNTLYREMVLSEGDRKAVLTDLVQDHN